MRPGIRTSIKQSRHRSVDLEQPAVIVTHDSDATAGK